MAFNLFLLIFLFSAALGKESVYLTITDKITSSYLNKSDFFLFVHNPWCKWSQRFQTALKKANSLLTNTESPFLIGEYDRTLNKVESFYSKFHPEFPVSQRAKSPQFFYFQAGKPIEQFKGTFSHLDILHFIKSKIFPQPLEISSEADLSTHLTQDNYSIILHNPDLKPKIPFSDFYIYPSDEKIALSVYKQGKLVEKVKTLTNSTITTITDKYKANRAFSKFKEEAIRHTFIEKQSTLFFFRNKWDDQTKAIEDQLPYLAKYEKSLKFVICDISSKFEIKLADLLKVTDSDLPTLRIVSFKDDSLVKYSTNEELTYENLLKFIQEYKGGYLTPFKHEKPHESTQQGRVVEISMNSFSEKVLNNRKHTVVFYTAKWCSLSKKVQF